MQADPKTEGNSMSEGLTTILMKQKDKPAISLLQDSINLLKVGRLEDVTYDEEGVCGFSFEHNGSYDEATFSKIVKLQCKEIGIDFLRAIHLDEYGTEIFWIYENGEYKKYKHDQDSEGPNIVKAYRHWHSNFDGLWFGGFSADEIDIMSERYGQYDGKGKKSKSEHKDYKQLIEAGEKFLKANVRAPYASSKWDYHAPVYESFARYYAEKSIVAPESGTFEYVRNYYFPNFLGYAWRWVSGGQEVVLLLTFPGDLGMERNLIVNIGKLAIDQLIILDRFGYLNGRKVSGQGYNFNQHVKLYDPFYKEHIIPPSTDYLYQRMPESYRLLKDQYNFDGMIINVMCDLERDDNGLYFCSGYTSGGVEVRINIFDRDFCQSLDKLPSEKYLDRDFYDLNRDRKYVKKIIYCEMQSEFDLDLNIRKVLRGRVVTIIEDPKKGLTEKVFVLSD